MKGGAALFPWNQVPKGADENLKIVARVFFAITILVVSTIGLVWLYNYLESKFGSGNSQVGTSLAKVSDFLGATIPLLFGLLLSTLIAYMIIRLILKQQHRKQILMQTGHIQIIPRSDIKLDFDNIYELVLRFGDMKRSYKKRVRYGSPWFRLRFAVPNQDGQIKIYLSFPMDQQEQVISAVSGIYSTAELVTMSIEELPIPSGKGYGGYFVRFRNKKPLATLKQRKKSSLGDILHNFSSGTFFDIQFSPVRKRKRLQRIFSTEAEKNQTGKIRLPKQFFSTETIFHCSMSLWSSNSQVLQLISKGIKAACKAEGSLRFWAQRWWNPVIDKSLIPIPAPFYIMSWSCEEMTNFIHIPPADHPLYHVTQDGGEASLFHLLPHQNSLGVNEWNSGLRIGQLLYPLNNNREVFVPKKIWQRHSLLVGELEEQKRLSATLLNSQFHLWQRHQGGITIIDGTNQLMPMIGELVKKFGVSKHLVHYLPIEPNATHLPGFNLFQPATNYPKEKMADRIAKIIVGKDDEASVRVHNLASKLVRTLLEDQEEHSLINLEDLLKNSRFRQQVIDRGNNPYIKRFWYHFDESSLKTEIDVILERIEQLMLNEMTRRLFAQRNNTLNIRQMMDQGHLVFIDTHALAQAERKLVTSQLLQLYQTNSFKREGIFHWLWIREEMKSTIQSDFLRDLPEENLGCVFSSRSLTDTDDEELLNNISPTLGLLLAKRVKVGSALERLTKRHFSRSFVEQIPPLVTAAYTRENGVPISFLLSDDLILRDESNNHNLREYIQESDMRPIAVIDQEVQVNMEETTNY